MKKWIILIVLMAAFVGAYRWMESTPTEMERVDLGQKAAGGDSGLKKATLTPGRVVELHTKKGLIELHGFSLE